MVWKNPPIPRNAEALLCHERLLTWDIKPGEKIAIFGGYQGVVVAYMLERYPQAEIYTWEPQFSMYSVMTDRFRDIGNVHIYNYGLGITTGVLPMMKAGSDACSYLIDQYNKPNTVTLIREFVSVMEELAIDKLAFMHVNIEGYEQVLLPHLIKTGWIKNIAQFVVSTHGIPKIVEGSEPWVWTVKQLKLTHKRYWTQRGFWAWTKPPRKTVHLPTVLGVPEEGKQEMK